MITSVIDRIRGRDTAIADTLAGLAEDFVYDEILKLIQGDKKE